MDREVKFSHVRETLEALEYPIDRATAADELADVTLLLADGSENFGDLVESTGSETFESPEDLETELHNALPREAVGEPYQSEGDA
ncbi:DUF5789 family protein [Halobellus rufus]|uniref:DUF5789 family protein n=1 Tax=Halobellus rufus TaxID=1448860 RepID=UPI00067851EF|nr:hypothetical protein [Halobellus rufus]